MTVSVRRVLWLVVGVLCALAAYVAATAKTNTANQAHAADSVLVHVKQASLQQNCGDQSIVGAHFVINQISAPPSTITVFLSDGSSVVVPLSKQTRSTAHYTLSFPADLTVVDATAWVPTSWTGQFVLSNYVCGSGSSTPPPTSSSPPVSGAPTS